MFREVTLLGHRSLNSCKCLSINVVENNDHHRFFPELLRNGGKFEVL